MVRKDYNNGNPNRNKTTEIKLINQLDFLGVNIKTFEQINKLNKCSFKFQTISERVNMS